MAKNNNIYLLIGAIFVLAVFVGGKNLNIFSAHIPTISNEIYYNPEFNTLTCQKLGDRQTSVPVAQTNPGFFGFGTRWETAEGAGADCTMETGQAGCDYDIKATNAQNYLQTTKMVGVSTIDNACVVGHKPVGLEQADWQGCVGEFVGSGSSAMKHVSANTRIKIFSTLSFLVDRRFNPLGLIYERGLGGQYVYNSESCRVQRFNSDDIIDITDTICIKDTTGKFCRGFKDTMLEGESISFFSGTYVASYGKKTLPSGVEGVPILGNVYGFGEIGLKDGTKLQIVDTGKILATYGIGQTLECVPGDSSALQTCGDDWRWHDRAIAEVSCRSQTECYVGEFAGGWSISSQDSKEQTIIRGACVLRTDKQQKISTGQTGVCNYEFESKQVGCTSNFQCSNATPVCDVGNTYTCIESESSGGGLTQQKEICDDEIDNDGDGKIDKDDEDCQNITGDICNLPVIGSFCKGGQLPTDLIIIGLIIILIAVFVLKPSGHGITVIPISGGSAS